MTNIMTQNSTLNLMVPSGSIEGYIHAVCNIPLLTAEEEHDLAVKYHDQGDLEAARKLVLAHLRFVISIARGYAGYGLPMADLIQEGTVGLMKAVKRFDVKQGVRLAAFAVHWIKAEIHDYVIKNWRLVKVATTKAQRKLFFKLRQTKKRIGWFSDSERKNVAEHLGVSAGDVEEMESRLTAQDVAFDGTTDDEEDDELHLTPASTLVDKSSDFGIAIANRDEEKKESLALNTILGKLDDRSYCIIKRRWLDENKATLQELADQFGVSIERVRQLEKAAMVKIKKMMLENKINIEA